MNIRGSEIFIARPDSEQWMKEDSRNRLLRQTRKDGSSGYSGFRPRTNEEVKTLLEKRTTKLPNGCWIWQGSTLRGYGVIKWNGRNWGAHRLAWYLHTGNLPSDLLVCHKCDNPPCVNPDHLFLGTHKDNTMDCECKGRGNHVRGSTHGNAIFTEAQILLIRKKYQQGIHVHELMKEFLASKATIYAITSRRHWKHI